MSRTAKQIEDYNEVKSIVCGQALSEIETLSATRIESLRLRLRDIARRMKVEEFKRFSDEILAEIDGFHDLLLQKPEFRLDEIENKLDGK
jgi:hypothetical protein